MRHNRPDIPNVYLLPAYDWLSHSSHYLCDTAPLLFVCVNTHLCAGIFPAKYNAVVMWYKGVSGSTTRLVMVQERFVL